MILHLHETDRRTVIINTFFSPLYKDDSIYSGSIFLKFFYSKYYIIKSKYISEGRKIRNVL
jgi:hypothetical protein